MILIRLLFQITDLVVLQYKWIFCFYTKNCVRNDIELLYDTACTCSVLFHRSLTQSHNVSFDVYREARKERKFSYRDTFNHTIMIYMLIERPLLYWISKFSVIGIILFIFYLFPYFYQISYWPWTIVCTTMNLHHLMVGWVIYR